MPTRIEEAHQRLSRRVLGLPGVSGTAIGIASGKPCLKVYLARRTEEALKAIPRTVEGFPVVIEKTGPFRPRTP